MIHDSLADNPGDGTIANGYNVGSVTEGLVAYYPLDEGAGRVAHDGALGNLGSFINSPSWISGIVGSNALDFSGGEDYVSAVDSPELRLMRSLNFTITMWVKRSSNVVDPLVLKYNPSTGYLVRFEDQSGSGIYGPNIYVSNGNTGSQDVIEVDKALADNTWYHLAFRRSGDGASGLSIFIDAVKQPPDYSTSQGAGKISSNQEDLEIGARPGSSRYFDGQMDDVRIYNRTLSQPEIEALANRSEPSGREVIESGVPSDSNNGVSRYEFESDVTDSWGSNDGTDNTSAGFTTGVYGDAKSFDGTDDYVELPSFGFGKSTPLSISSWALFNANSSENVIGRYDGTNKIINLNWNNNSAVWAFQIGDVAANQLKVQGGSLTTGTWEHIVITYDPSGPTAKIYQDGRQVASETGAVDDFSTTTGPWVGARTDGARYLDGNVDDVRVYDKVLSPTEVEELYNLGTYRINRSDLV